ncbi:uncharacterized protein LOC112172561 isoform X2 [Rosa chinensis]|nr:uncharacterized protein LOC121049707 isoform X2 [Rosa chinensis]XP_040364698.1 uncharacterized protein LOC112172561 isoform X2 [Rosa chinensis]
MCQEEEEIVKGYLKARFLPRHRLNAAMALVKASRHKNCTGGGKSLSLRSLVDKSSGFGFLQCSWDLNGNVPYKIFVGSCCSSNAWL